MNKTFFTLLVFGLVIVAPATYAQIKRPLSPIRHPAPIAFTQVNYDPQTGRTDNTPEDVAVIPLLIDVSSSSSDAFGAAMAGSLIVNPKASTADAQQEAPLAALVKSLRVEMINPPDNIMIHGMFVSIGSRLRVTFQQQVDVLTLISVAPNQIVFGWDKDSAQATIPIESANYAQILGNQSNPDPLSDESIPNINLDAPGKTPIARGLKPHPGYHR